MDEKGAKIVPATKSHAIEVMAFAVEWLNPITSSDFTDILTIYDGSAYLRQHLPRKNGIGGFKIQVIQGSGVPMSSSAAGADEIAGYDFQQFLPDGTMSWSVAIRPKFISCNCSTYDRWKTTKATALSLLMPFLDCIVGKTADRKISGFGLQYQDMFKLEGNISAFSLQQLMRVPNRRIPSIAFEHQSFWHVHQGWFSETSERRRVLNLLNIDYLEQAGLYAFRINGQHRMLSVDIHSAEKPQALAELSGALDHMHDLNKTVLSELLNDTVLLQIGMDTPA